MSSPREEASALAARISVAVGGVVEGKPDAIRLSLTALFAGGHLLLEDVPGVGKTTLARALARALGLSFRRLQFTSDLMPADVLGGSVYDQATSAFLFRPGPVFTHVLVADEINRTTPKTQSALLEVMSERRVSIEGETHVLTPPFFVVATQNPIEFHGTYPLPESQLDRFLIRLGLGPPPPEVERALLGRRGIEDPVLSLEPLADRDALLEAQAAVDEVRVEAPVLDYAHELILATRSSPLLALGASTRAALDLVRAVRAHAIVSGRGHALPDDVKTLAGPVLAHRLRGAGASELDDRRDDVERVIADLLERIAIPV